MYTRTTHNIKVTVIPAYLAEQSNPELHHYVWAYNIHLENFGEKTVRLINRYWHITDANGGVHEVRGPGVVGEQPVLRRGDSYRYTSGASLRTASGLMVGQYEMSTADGETLHIDIPAFSLDSPHQVARPN